MISCWQIEHREKETFDICNLFGAFFFSWYKVSLLLRYCRIDSQSLYSVTIALGFKENIQCFSNFTVHVILVSVLLTLIDWFIYLFIIIFWFSLNIFQYLWHYQSMYLLVDGFFNNLLGIETPVEINITIWDLFLGVNILCTLLLGIDISPFPLSLFCLVSPQTPKFNEILCLKITLDS